VARIRSIGIPVFGFSEGRELELRTRDPRDPEIDVVAWVPEHSGAQVAHSRTIGVSAFGSLERWVLISQAVISR
jgi:hypothetical protein